MRYSVSLRLQNLFLKFRLRGLQTFTVDVHDTKLAKWGILQTFCLLRPNVSAQQDVKLWNFWLGLIVVDA